MATTIDDDSPRMGLQSPARVPRMTVGDIPVKRGLGSENPGRFETGQSNPMFSGAINVSVSYAKLQCYHYCVFLWPRFFFLNIDVSICSLLIARPSSCNSMCDIQFQFHTSTQTPLGRWVASVYNASTKNVTNHSSYTNTGVAQSCTR
jgi:hypothetical protein